LLNAVLNLPPAWELSHGACDDLERIAAGLMAAIRQERLAYRGGRIGRAWRDGPGAHRHEYGSYEVRGRWLDHSYTVRFPDGEKEYRSEPYTLDEDSLEELLVLSRQGWDIVLDPHMALHFPGFTHSIVITKTQTKPGSGTSGG
jgi:hypothetical protein